MCRKSDESGKFDVAFVDCPAYTRAGFRYSCAECGCPSVKKVRGEMDESIEKSCWGITLWAIAVVLVVVLIGSFVLGSGPTINATTITTGHL